MKRENNVFQFDHVINELNLEHGDYFRTFNIGNILSLGSVFGWGRGWKVGGEEGDDLHKNPRRRFPIKF